MNDPIVKLPGPEHPISMTKAKSTWRVVFNNAVIAESEDVLLMQEATYPVVAYFPRKDVKMNLLQATDHHTYCPYKGQASYFSLDADGRREDNAVWSYEAPYPAVADIKERLAFYTTKVDEIAEV